MRREQPGHLRTVATGARVAQRVEHHVVVRVPGRGTPVGEALAVAVLMMQPCAQQLAEQPVEAPPAGLPGHAVHEAGRGGEALQRRVSVGNLGQGLGQRAADGVDAGGVEQKVAVRARQSIEDLGHQVVPDEAVVTGEPGDERGRVALALQAQGGHPQSGGPAFRARLQRGDRCLVEVEPVRAEQARRLAAVERQGVGADLAQQRANAQDVQWQHRIRPGGEHDGQRGRHVQQQEAELVAHRARAQEVHVVEHEHGRGRKLGQCVDQQRRELGRGRHAGLQLIERGAGRDSAGRAQARQHRAPQPVRVIVLALERHPADRPIRPRRPVRDQRRLPGTGGPAHECHGRHADAFGQPRSRDRPARAHRDLDLRAHQRRVGDRRELRSRLHGSSLLQPRGRGQGRQPHPLGDVRTTWQPAQEGFLTG